MPLAMLITPNIPEAQILSEMEIHDEADMVQAARHIQQRYSCSVLIKGGHQINDANDYLQTADHGQWFYGKRIGQSQYPRHWLHALQRHRGQSGQGIHAG